MGSLMDSIKTVNSAFRTILLTALVGVIALGSYFVYREYTQRERLFRDQEQQIEAAQQQLVSLQGELESKEATIDLLNVDLKAKGAQIEKLQTALHLLKTDQRLARLNVISIERDEAGNAVKSKLAFVELTPQGDSLSEPKVFELPGDVIYIDNWVVKFDDSYIEKGDIERGTSLCLFRRIFSEQQTPTEGVSLDQVGMRPQAYARGGNLSDFEERLWSEFWEFANNPAKAAKLGIRAANGEAVSIKVREGKAYHVSLRASGGLSIAPVPSSISGQ